MNRKFFPWSMTLFLLSFLCILSSCENDNDNKGNAVKTTINLTGIEFTPNCYSDSGKMVGIDYDIATAALQQAGVNVDFKTTNVWEEGYNATVNGKNRAMITVGYSADRKDQFKWAGPTSQGLYGIFCNGESGYTFPLSIEASKQIGNIAVVRNWLETKALEDLGFNNLVYYDTYEAALKDFMNGTIKFISSDFYHLLSSLPTGYFMANVMTVTRYQSVYYYIAFSKDVDDAIVAKCQSAIETMIKNKKTVEITRRYFSIMPDDYIPGTIQLFTEATPPLSYIVGKDTARSIIGSAVDVVNEIQRRTGYMNKINVTTWVDAYSTPQYLPNSAVFTTARTAERENKFQWVGPINKDETYIYTLAGSGIDTIRTLEQAKALQSIATPNEWFTHEFLRNNNFTNIVATAITSQDALDQLINGDVQALYMTSLDMTWLVKQNGKSMSDFTRHMKVSDYEGYIAFSLTTPKTLVQQWQRNLDAMKEDGTFETISNKWFEGTPMP
ncbi:MAG: transporter substrate-binding domain-containing protein [Bacteroidales bacterium]|nr:transporter substrate-binding domain-containing protein [Bacteroidales bacterium]